jgi:uncharacterized SAM-binding protein YcdF (DUF218 family)
MIEDSACQATVAGYWAELSRQTFDLLQRQRLVLPALAGTVIALYWILPWRRSRRYIRRACIAVLVGYLIVSMPITASIGSGGLRALVPPDTGEAADAIVILGRGPELRLSRVEVATQLWQQGRAPEVFASGRGDAEEIAQMLHQEGVPEMAINGESCSATTNENAEYTATILQPRGMKRIILVTDPPHMMRSLLTFKSLGFDVIPHVSPIPPEVDSEQRTFLVFREWFGLVSYGVMGRYFSRQVPESALSLYRHSQADGADGLTELSKA